MKAVYKWRLKNGVYGYITDEQDESAFIYDQTTFEREYPDGTVVSGSSVDELVIANIVSKKSKAEYTEMFNEFKAFVNIKYPDVAFLDVIYYYNVENDECSASAGTLKCVGSDILFRVKNVSSGLQPQVTIEPINTNPEMGDLKYDMSFVLPISFISGETPTFDSITSREFIKSGGTSEQYLMADGSVSVLSAGTNVTIATATTTGGKVVTINSNGRSINVNDTQLLDNSTVSGLTLSAGTNVTLATTDSGNNKVVTINSNDTNTWRNIKVDNTQILDNSTVSGLTLSAGTNVTLSTSDSGNNKVVTINSNGRSINVNDTQLLDNSTVSGLTLNAGTNVTLTTGSGNGHKIVYISATGSGGGSYQNGRNITIDGDNKINANGYTFDIDVNSVSLFDTITDTELTYQGLYDDLSSSAITVNNDPREKIVRGDTLIINEIEYVVKQVSAFGDYIQFETPFNDSGVAIGTKIYEKIQNKASAKRSFAAGTGTNAYKESMTVVGKYNIEESNTHRSDILFAVGNGSKKKWGSNAFIVRKDGSIHIHSTTDPTSEKNYGGRIDFGDGSTAKANVYIEEDTNDHLSIKSNEGVTFITNSGATVNARVNGVENVQLGLPIGTVVMWPGSTAPNGWLLCNGGSIDVEQADEDDYDFKRVVIGGSLYYKAENTEYRTLLKIIGDTYGVVTGVIMSGTTPIIVTTGACLPDFRGMFPIGAGQAPNTHLGEDSQNLNWNFLLGQNDANRGEYKHKLTVSEMPLHTHEQHISYKGTLYDLTASTVTEGGIIIRQTGRDSYADRTDATYIKNEGSSVAHNNVPPYIVVNFIIKYK